MLSVYENAVQLVSTIKSGNKVAPINDKVPTEKKTREVDFLPCQDSTLPARESFEFGRGEHNKFCIFTGLGNMEVANTGH